MPPTHYVIKMGNLYYGPFKSAAEADDYATTNHHGFDWAIMPLYKPLKKLHWKKVK